MTRARIAVLALAAAALVPGCTTFSDNNLAARVNDIELTKSALGDLMTEAGATEVTPGRYDASLARGEITKWVQRQIAVESGLLDRYATGDDPLPVVCFFVLPTADHAASEALVARLESGETWAEIAESLGPDAAVNTRQPCGTLNLYIPEVAEQLATLQASGEPIIIDSTDPVGSFVVRAHTLEELDLREFLTAVNTADPQLVQDTFGAAIETADIYVDPRFGRFDTAQFSVAPLG